MIVENEIILDKVDLSILRLMQENARISNADMARELNMAPSGVLERVKKLEQKKCDPAIYNTAKPGTFAAKATGICFYESS